MNEVTTKNTTATGSPYLTKSWKGSSHEITRRYATTLSPGSRILDIGMATGLLGRALLPSRYQLFGIEPDAGRADEAVEFYDEVFVGTLNEAPDEFIRAFDLVVCCDVLEHMARPEAQLIRLVKAQEQHTRFIFSVPNVAHLWIRLNLLLGRFDYTDRGILDRTHLRFFTRNSMVRMLENSGLETLWVRSTPVPLELLHPAFLGSRFGRLFYSLHQWSATALPRLLGYQFVSLARRAEL
jgi:predicted TPR repeat methyltransferase